MPLIRDFKSNSLWKAFVLNSIASTLIIFIAMTTKSTFDKHVLDKDENTNKSYNIKTHINIKSVVLTLLFTFMTSMAAYTLMWLIFGFGGGMMVES